MIDLPDPRPRPPSHRLPRLDPPGPVPAHRLAVEAVEKMLDDHPQAAWTRVRQMLIDACPPFAESWALEYVADAVVQGVVPEFEVHKAVVAFGQRVRRRDPKPIADPPAYLAAMLKRLFSHHGLPWKAPRHSRDP